MYDRPIRASAQHIDCYNSITPSLKVCCADAPHSGAIQYIPFTTRNSWGTTFVCIIVGRCPDVQHTASFPVPLRVQCWKDSVSSRWCIYLLVVAWLPRRLSDWKVVCCQAVFRPTVLPCCDMLAAPRAFQAQASLNQSFVSC